VYQPTVVPLEAAQPSEVEVEGVEEARPRPTGDDVLLDDELTPLELAHERTEKLVTTAGRGWLELVEHGEIGSTAARSEKIELRSSTVEDGTRRGAGSCRRTPSGHAPASSVDRRQT
jgi:hypothetical protein